jgi:hypothetical protein
LTEHFLHGILSAKSNDDNYKSILITEGMNMSENKNAIKPNVFQTAKSFQDHNSLKMPTITAASHKLSERLDTKLSYEKPYIFIYSKEDKDFWCD